MPVVLLVRHGQASFGADDYDVLSDVGRRQGEALRAELARRGLRDPVPVSGGLRRQQDTARVALPGAPLVVDRRWDEYDHRGLLQRYPSAEASDGSSRSVQVLLDAALRAWVHDPGGGWDAFGAGAEAALQDLVAGLSGTDAVVFTSGGVIAAVCARLLGLGADGVVALNRVAVNGAVTKLVAGRAGVSLVAFNDHAHFEGADRGLLTYR